MSADKKITVNPYLTFEGNCREAMKFYKEALNGELEMMEFAGSPAADSVPEEYQHNIMHASLVFGDAVIMASDGRPGEPVTMGNGVNISVSVPDAEEGERMFNSLAVGGKVMMPFSEQFWGAKFGMLTDRFGYNWMVNCELYE